MRVLLIFIFGKIGGYRKIISQWWEVGKVHIKNLLQEQVKNALIRSRFCSVKDMDAPSTCFFKLERNLMQHNPMLHLRCPDGTITDNPN